MQCDELFAILLLDSVHIVKRLNDLPFHNFMMFNCKFYIENRIFLSCKVLKLETRRDDYAHVTVVHLQIS